MKKILGTIIIFTVFTGLLLFSEQHETGQIEQMPVLKDAGGFWYICMEFKGPYSLIAEKSTIFDAEISKQNIKTEGLFIVVYYNSPRIFKPEELEWATAYPVSENVQVKSPLKKVEFKKAECVVCLHTGPLKETQKSNDKVKEFIENNGYKMVWPAYEIFFGDPMKVEIIHPVVKK